MVGGLFGMFFLGALYLQRVLGYDAIEIGLAFLPVSLGIGDPLARLSRRGSCMRFGPRAVLLAGLASIAGGLALFSPASRSTATTSPTCCPRCSCSAPARGLSFPALMALAMTGATAEDSGLLSGLVNTTQQVGAALGLAVLATLATSRSDEPARRRRQPGRRAHRRLHARVRVGRRVRRRRDRDRGRSALRRPPAEAERAPRARARLRGGRVGPAGLVARSCRACPSSRSSA